MLKHVEWTDRYGEGRAAIRLDGDYVTFKTLCGKNLSAEYLLAVLDAALGKGWRQKAEELHQSRKHPWRIDTYRGTSGCRDIILRYLRDEYLWDTPTAARIHISMFWKVSYFAMWLGDLAPIAAEIKRIYPQVELPEEEEYGRFWIETRDGGYLKIRVIEPRSVDFNDPGNPSGLLEEPSTSVGSQASEPEPIPEVEVV